VAQQIAPITFIKGDKIGIETDYRDSLPVNMQAVDRSIIGADGYMLQSPGLVKIGRLAALSGDPNAPEPIEAGRSYGGVYNSNVDSVFRVFEDRLYRKIRAGSGSVEEIGVLGGDLENASMPHSFNTQAVLQAGVFGLYKYSDESFNIYNMSFNLRDPVDVTWIDGYYVFTNGEYIYHTDLQDETVIGPWQFNGAELSPDEIVGVSASEDNKLIVWGRFTIEYFSNTANQFFAFTRLNGRQLKIGLLATHLKAEAGGKWYFIGSRNNESLGVHILSGGTTQKISTREIDKVLESWAALRGSTKLSSIESRTEKDSKLIIIHLSAQSILGEDEVVERETLCFNLDIAAKFGIESAWSYLSSSSRALNDGLDQLIPGPFVNTWQAIHGVYDDSEKEWVYADKFDNRLGRLDYNVATTYDEPTEWLLYTPFYYLDSASLDEIEVETIPGHTSSNDATVFISLTYNGLTHGLEHSEDYGMINEYGKRFIIRRLGYVRDWFAIKMRGVSRSRVAFGRGLIKYD
tara:strand:+ start:2570 stop:4123 length:1554 start_codon:yes stop_codon:yes gene_type:complete